MTVVFPSDVELSLFDIINTIEDRFGQIVATRIDKQIRNAIDNLEFMPFAWPEETTKKGVLFAKW